MTDEPRRFGLLVSPYPVDRCAADHCRVELTAETEALLFTNLETGKLTVFCGACALFVELNRRDRFALVML